jgi:selenophosphate synthetase-related protein
MRFASAKFAIPVVGGHTNQHSPYNALSVAVLGACHGPVLSARAARPGDHLCLLINISGRFYRHYPFWDAATEAAPAVLRAHLELMAQLAETGLVHAAKDISMGGLVGTAVMFAEATGCTLQLQLDAITPPAGVSLEAWLSCFPSYGYLLAVTPERLQELHRGVAPYPDLLCAKVGRFAAGEAEVQLHQGDQCRVFWSGVDGLTGFGARPGEPP